MHRGKSTCKPEGHDVDNAFVRPDNCSLHRLVASLQVSTSMVHEKEESRFFEVWV